MNPSELPTHVGIIMDGNGRWATERGLPRLLGHREGYKTLRTVLLAANDLGLKYLTVYAFSAENWKRPKDEVDGLMALIERAAIDELRIMHQNGVRVRTAGRLHEVPEGLQKALRDGVETTKDNRGITFTLAINYGGRAEIVDAANLAIAEGATSVSEEAISSHLYNPDIPEPDLLVRTAGEMRLSNFLLWQGAYAELVVVDRPWPDFTEQDLV
ncbi:MAG: polyprenyl diphosphate synthase, partial [Fimbriimonadales bacterium]